MKTEEKKLFAFREVVELLIQNSLLLSFEEKQEFTGMVKVLGFDDLKELFRILVGSRKDVDKILTTISRDFPEVEKKMNKFQRNIIKKIFKGERDFYKSIITK
jgi:hypothetical protein